MPFSTDSMSSLHASGEDEGKFNHNYRCFLKNISDTIINFNPVHNDLLFILRDLMNDSTANWTIPAQRQAVVSMLHRQDDLILAMRTGSGKKLAVVIPPQIEQGITVIIIPSSPLPCNDWFEYLQEMNINFEWFGSNKTSLDGQHNIVVVEADIALTPCWARAVQEINQTSKPVIRIVVDNAQIYLQNTTEVKAFRHWNCQLVLISGSAAPHIVPALETMFGFIRPSTVIRSHSSRNEMIYLLAPSIINTDYDSASHIVQHYIDWICSNKHSTVRWDYDKDRFLIFCPDEDLAYALAPTLLGVKVYSKSSEGGKYPMDAARQAYIHEMLVEGVLDGIIVTSGSEMGWSYDNVRLVIHIGQGSSMNHLIQQISHAGRDGEPAISVLIPFTKMNIVHEWTPLHKLQQGFDHLERMTSIPRVKTYPEMCLRYQILSYSDVEAYPCAQYAFGLLCQSCSKCGTIQLWCCPS